jgi:hypothetical protein
MHNGHHLFTFCSQSCAPAGSDAEGYANDHGRRHALLGTRLDADSSHRGGDVMWAIGDFALYKAMLSPSLATTVVLPSG